jgi:hypothetical protein
VIHVYKENKLGGNVCAKVVFFGLLGALGLMVGLIIFEYHGTSDGKFVNLNFLYRF